MKFGWFHKAEIPTSGEEIPGKSNPAENLPSEVRPTAKDAESVRQEEGRQMEQHLLNIFDQNVLSREMYSQVKREEWNFLLKRDRDSVNHIFQESILSALDKLRKNDNNLDRVKEDIDSKTGEGWYEKRVDKGLYESLHEVIAEEEKRAVLFKELWKRHPQNPIFKTGWLRAPEDAENKGAYAEVFCATHEGALDRIGKDGLKFAGEEIMDQAEVAAGEVNTAKMELEKIFKELAPAGYNRRLSVFAVPEYRDPARSGAMGGMGNVVLEVMVDADRAMVFDVEKYNVIGEGMQFSGSSLDEPNFREEALKAAKDYWNSGMPLSKYLKLSLAEQERLFTSPEILIPDAVPPEQIKAISMLAE